MKKISVSISMVAFLLSACSSDPASNPNVNGGTAGSAGDAKINCVSRGGLLVSKQGGGWWCKLNGELRSLDDFL